MGVGNRSEKRLETALLDTRGSKQRNCVPEAGNRCCPTTLSHRVQNLDRGEFLCNNQIELPLNSSRAYSGQTIANFSFFPVSLRALHFNLIALSFSFAPWNSSIQQPGIPDIAVREPYRFAFFLLA